MWIEWIAFDLCLSASPHKSLYQTGGLGWILCCMACDIARRTGSLFILMFLVQPCHFVWARKINHANESCRYHCIWQGEGRYLIIFSHSLVLLNPMVESCSSCHDFVRLLTWELWDLASTTPTTLSGSQKIFWSNTHIHCDNHLGEALLRKTWYGKDMTVTCQVADIASKHDCSLLIRTHALIVSDDSKNPLCLWLHLFSTLWLFFHLPRSFRDTAVSFLGEEMWCSMAARVVLHTSAANGRQMNGTWQELWYIRRDGERKRQGCFGKEHYISQLQKYIKPCTSTVRRQELQRQY
jgi:hypothetical protein